MKGCVQILGGTWKGKKLYFPTNTTIRPTPSRVRETLFNWLMHDIQGARCLDAFAGSGALGLEAYSRGAKTVDLLEISKPTYHYLQAIQKSIVKNGGALHVYCADAVTFLKNTQQPYDIIFLDPPFNSHFFATCIACLEEYPALKNQGLLYVESSIALILPENKWQQLKSKQTGQVIYSLYQKC